MIDHATEQQAEAIRTMIKNHRERVGLTRFALAQLLGVDHSQVVRWENGARQPSLAALRRFLRYRGLTPDERKEVVTAVFGIDPDTWKPQRMEVRR